MNTDQKLHGVVDKKKHQHEKPHGFARGGDTKMFGAQGANKKTSGITGKVDARPVGKFGKGGAADRIFGGYSTPAQAGVTANTRSPQRSRTRDYHK